MVAKGCYLENEKAWEPNGGGATLTQGWFFRIWGPARGMITSDIPNLVDGNGDLAAPITWPQNRELKAGQAIVAHMKDNTGAYVKQVQGKALTVGLRWMAQGGNANRTIFLNVIMQYSSDVAAIQSEGANVNMNEQVLNGNFHMSNQDGTLSESIKAYFTFNSTDAAGDPTAIVSSTQVLMAPVAGRDISTFERHASSGDARTVFTPNEFFWIFNKPDDQFPILPYNMTTDENGGFQIDWDSSAFKGVTDFKVSKPMCDSLGLNPYFEYDKRNVTSTNREFLVVAEKSIEDANQISQTFANRIITAGSVSVFIYRSDGGTEVAFDPENPPVFGTLVRIGSHIWRYITLTESTQSQSTSTRVFIQPTLMTDGDGTQYYNYHNLPHYGKIGNTSMVSVESWSTYSQINLVIPNLPFQPMLGSDTDSRILASLRLPFEYETNNDKRGKVSATSFDFYGDLLFNSDSSRSYLRITTDQQLFDCDVEARLIRRDGQMDIMQLPFQGQFQVKLRFLQTQ